MFTDKCKTLGFPDESLAELENAYLLLLENGEWLQKARESLITPNTAKFNEAFKALREKTGVHAYSINAVLCISCLDDMRKKYELADKLDRYFEYENNVTPSLVSCKKSTGVWGHKSALWNWLFHELGCVRLGRLQFETYFHFANVEYKGIKLNDPVILIHIPGGEKLDMDEVERSLQLGYEKFKDSFEDGTVPFMTHSWLIYPPYSESVFKKGSNLERFARLFNVIESNDEKFSNFATVFGMPYSKENLEKAPQETSLQRNMLKFIKDGNPMGQGYGMFLYGENGVIK